jgi:hypothetical protein
MGVDHMTKDKALHAWFNQFMMFYPSTNVPDFPTFPYGTYEYVSGNFDSGENAITVYLWFYTESEAIPNAKAEELGALIDNMPSPIPCDGGRIWLKRGKPWCSSLVDSTNPSAKGRYINVTVEYLTRH